MADRIPSPGLPEVSPRGAPAPYLSPAGISPDATGGDAGPIVRQVADIAQGYFHAEREKVVSAQTMQAEADIENGINGQILEFRKLQGADAGPRSQEFIEKIGKAREKALEDISDPDVKRLATMRTAGAVTMAQKHIGDWTSKQNEVAAENGFKALSTARLNAVAMNALDPIARQREMDQMQGPLLAEGRRLGLAGNPTDPETPLGAFVHDWKAQAALVVMHQAASTRNGAVAQQTFASVRELLDPKERAHYDEVIVKIGAAEQGEAIARDITKRSMGPDGQVDRRKQQALLDALPPSPAKDEAQHRADHKADIFDKAWRDEATKTGADVLDSMTGEDGRLSPERVDPDAMTRLERIWPQKAAEIKKRALVDRRLASTEDSKARYADALDDFLTDRASFAKMTMEEFESTYRPQLETKHYNAFLQKFEHLKRNVDVSPAESARVEAQVFAETKKALGLDIKLPGTKARARRIADLPTDKKAQAIDLVEAVSERVKQWSVDNEGKAFPRPQELRDIIAEEMGPAFDGGPRVFEQKAADRRAKQAMTTRLKAVVPAVEQEAIRNALKSKGKPVDDAQVLYLYYLAHPEAP